MTITTATRQGAGWTVDASTFGARLALIRQHMGWGNVAEAAKACGIATASWRNWERDNRDPRRITQIAKQISTATGCDYLWLLIGPDGVDGGGGGTTRQYFADVRSVATIGHGIRDLSGRRPVRRTQPRAANRARPVTAVAA